MINWRTEICRLVRQSHKTCSRQYTEFNSHKAFTAEALTHHIKTRQTQQEKKKYFTQFRSRVRAHARTH